MEETMQKHKKVVVMIGAGAVGGYFGGRLAQAGHCHFHFIARGRTLEVLKAHGLRVDSMKGDFRLTEPAFHVTDRPAEILESSPNRSVDYVMVATKGDQQLREVLPSIKLLCGESTVVLPLQNGIEAPGIISEAVGAKHVLGGYCKIASHIVSPGHICHEGAEPTVGFGELSSEGSGERVSHLRDLWEKADVKVETPKDIRVGMWEKLMLIASLSGVGSVARAPLGPLMQTKETSELIERALLEAVKVAQADGVDLQEQTAKNVFQFLKGRASATPNSTSSMQRDICRGLPSELEWQIGVIVRKGKQHGVDTPVHSFVYASLLPLEKKARQEIDFIDPAKADDKEDTTNATNDQK